MWKTQDGIDIKICDLDDQHILNIKRYIESYAEKGLTLSYGGGGWDIEDIWYDDDILYGKEVLDYFDYDSIINEINNRKLFMKHKVKQILFTDKTKDGNPLKNKSGAGFFMLHIELENGDWVSKYYSNDTRKQKVLDDIKVGNEYEFFIKESGPYKNIIEIRDLKGDVII